MAWLLEYDFAGGHDIEIVIRNIDALDSWPTQLSVRLGKGFPVIDLALESCNGPLPDFFRVGPLRIASGRLKTIVERFGGHAEFLPVSIRGAAIAPSIGVYFYMRPLDELPCMDAKQSEFTMDDQYIDEIRHFIIDESIAKQRPMFRLAQSYSMPLFVSDELAEAMRAAKLTGVRLDAPNTFTHY